MVTIDQVFILDFRAISDEFDHPAHEGSDSGLDGADEGRVVHLEARPLVHQLGHGAAVRLLVGVQFSRRTTSNTGLGLEAVPRFGELGCCSCLPLLPGLVCTIHAT